MILADKITEERKKNGWSQEELANQLGVSRQAVSKWESAGAVPDLQRILQMECVNHIWNILKKNALKQSMVYLEWYEKKKIPMNQFLSEEQLLG